MQVVGWWSGGLVGGGDVGDFAGNVLNVLKNRNECVATQDEG